MAEDTEVQSGPYRVVKDGGSCKECGCGQLFTVAIGTGDEETAIGESFGSELEAADLAEYMNIAYAAGAEKWRIECDRLANGLAETFEDAEDVDVTPETAVDAAFAKFDELVRVRAILLRP